MVQWILINFCAFPGSWQFITEMFEIFSNTTNKSPYTAALVYRENYDLYLKGIKKYYEELHVRSIAWSAPDLITEHHHMQVIDSVIRF